MTWRLSVVCSFCELRGPARTALTVREAERYALEAATMNGWTIHEGADLFICPACAPAVEWQRAERMARTR